MPVSFAVLGSGSGGNCAYVETDQTRLLVDAGLSARQIRQRLLSLGRAPEGLNGILITHEHTDHVQALAVLAAKLQIPVYCNRLTMEAIQAQCQAKLDYRLFITGATFELGDVAVETFSVPHDAYDPVGFLLRTGAGDIGLLTDLGHATRLVIQRVRSARLLVLETNHDVKMLQEDPRRPWSLKQRILSRHGHLSNEAAAEAVAQIANADLQRLVLAHLSADCNRPELAARAVSAALRQVGATHVELAVARQEQPTALWRLDQAAGVPADACAATAANSASNAATQSAPAGVAGGPEVSPGTGLC
jgi:phosphoribosyl 1,2-cyclic phosphodiesterase